MADFAAVLSTNATGFTNAEGGEVVVEDETFGGFSAGVAVEFLGFFHGGEGGQAEGLGLAAAEEGRAVGAGEESDFSTEDADVLDAATVGTFALVEDALAEGFLLEVVEGAGDGEGRGFGIFFDGLEANFFFEFGNGLLAFDLAGAVDGAFDAVSGDFVGELKELLGNDEEGGVALGLAGFGGEILLEVDDDLDLFLGEGECLFEFSLGEDEGAAFDHEDVGFGSDVDEVEVALEHLGVRRVGDELAVDAGDADGTDGAGKGDVGDHEGGGGAVDAEDVGIVFTIGREEGGDDLGVVEVALGEERPQGAVGHATGEDFLFGGAAFTFEVATGEFADGGGALAVFNSQGEEILAFLDGGGGDGGDDDDGFAVANGDGSVGQFGDFASLDDNRELAVRCGDTNGCGHVFLGLLTKARNPAEESIEEHRGQSTLPACAERLIVLWGSTRCLARGGVLFAKVEFFDERIVAAGIGALQVAEQLAALIDHPEESATRTVIFFELLQVTGQLSDALCEQGNLDVGGAGVFVVQTVFFCNSGFFQTFHKGGQPSGIGELEQAVFLGKCVDGFGVGGKWRLSRYGLIG